MTLWTLVFQFIRPSVPAIITAVTQRPVRNTAVVIVTARPACLTLLLSCKQLNKCDKYYMRTIRNRFRIFCVRVYGSTIDVSDATKI